MLKHIVNNISTTSDTHSVKDGVGTVLSTLVAHHESSTGRVTALAPRPESGSSAVIQSGKTVVSTFEIVKQLEKEIQIYTSSHGKKYTKQHKVGTHDKDLLKRILDFSNGGNHEILKESEDDKHLGTYESADGYKVHVVKYLKEAAKTSTSRGLGLAIAEHHPAKLTRAHTAKPTSEQVINSTLVPGFSYLPGIFDPMTPYSNSGLF
jgi:hypothetical protein